MDTLEAVHDGPRTSPLAVVVMGVAGCGKSTIGLALASALDARLIDADAHHPPANIAKMTAGHPLDDADRAPWLDAVAREIRSVLDEGRPVVCACSALRRAYRDRLRAAAGDLAFVHLTGSRPLLEARLRSRTGHFMRAGMLDSQLATLEPLEPDERGVAVAIDLSVPEQTSRSLSWLRRLQSESAPAV
jgi:gluconokinase